MSYNRCDCDCASQIRHLQDQVREALDLRYALDELKRDFLSAERRLEEQIADVSADVQDLRNA